LILFIERRHFNANTLSNFNDCDIVNELEQKTNTCGYSYVFKVKCKFSDYLLLDTSIMEVENNDFVGCYFYNMIVISVYLLHLLTIY
jgi:hypothetical protein